MATLLYVDDEEMIGMVVSRFFAMRGHTVRHVRSIADAQEAVAREEPAVIFLDVWLDGEHGADLMAWLVDHHPSLADRVTFVTGEHPGALPTAPWTQFGRPVIRKPFDLLTLAETLEQAQNGSGT